jgi:hypothetical protein
MEERLDKPILEVSCSSEMSVVCNQDGRRKCQDLSCGIDKYANVPDDRNPMGHTNARSEEGAQERFAAINRPYVAWVSTSQGCRIVEETYTPTIN